MEAELWDRMHYLFRDYNDRMIHAQLHYDRKIDPHGLRAALERLFRDAPVLHSSFVPHRRCPYWTVRDLDMDAVLSIRHVPAEEAPAQIDRFLLQCIPPESPVQMKAAVFYWGGGSTLCLVVNHMCMDGGDVKYFLRTLCRCYNEYMETGRISQGLRQGSRAYDMVYKDMTDGNRDAAKRLYRNINTRDCHRLPLTAPDMADAPFIIRHKLSAGSCRIKDAAKGLGATVNDMLLASFFHSLCDLADFREGIAISCAIDLRRHMKDDTGCGLTNHTAWMQCKVPHRGADVFETLAHTVRSTQSFRRDPYMGLHGLPLLSGAYKRLPQWLAERLVRIGYANPYIAMSNIGVLEGLALEGQEPVDGFLSGSVKYKPFFLLTATTLHDEITLSTCVRGGMEDRRIVSLVMDLMDQNVSALTTPPGTQL